MIPTAKKLLIYGISAIVLGTLLAAYGVDMFVRLSNVVGGTADTGLQAVSLVITLLRGILVPVGAALVGAAVVINVLGAAVLTRDKQEAAIGAASSDRDG